MAGLVPTCVISNPTNLLETECCVTCVDNNILCLNHFRDRQQSGSLKIKKWGWWWWREWGTKGLVSADDRIHPADHTAWHQICDSRVTLSHQTVRGLYCAKKIATIHQVNTMLDTSKNVVFPGHNHLPTTGTHNSDICLLPEVFFAFCIRIQQYLILRYFSYFAMFSVCA